MGALCPVLGPPGTALHRPARAQHGGYAGRNTTAWRRNEDEETTEWCVCKSDLLYDMVDFYEREATNVSNQLYQIISSSNVALEEPINCRSAAKLGPLFLKFL